MIKVTVESEREVTEWEVIGANEIPCANDILNNRRHELSDYITNMFRQRYGCTARIITK